jgi:methylated-DNA-protein-cysteine methyltransferase related protein
MTNARRPRPLAAVETSAPGSASPTPETVIIETIRAIPEGFVRTYGDVYPSAPRLVGRVLATTAEDVPWHRVVRSDGTVAKGAVQLRLLRREGVPLLGTRVDLRTARLPH